MSKMSNVRYAWPCPRFMDTVDPDLFEMTREAIPIVTAENLLSTLLGFRCEPLVIANPIT